MIESSTGLERFKAPRYEDLYRGWISLGDEAFRSPSCPAIIEALEDAVGKPVLTANQVTVWKGLHLLGEVPALPGLGTLFGGRR